MMREPKHVAGIAWKQKGLVTIKVGDSKDGRPQNGGERFLGKYFRKELGEVI